MSELYYRVQIDETRRPYYVSACLRLCQMLVFIQVSLCTQP